MHLQRGENGGFGFAIAVSVSFLLTPVGTPPLLLLTPPLVISPPPCLPVQLLPLFALQGCSGDASAGVLVRNVTEGGSADGRLQVRDRLLSINGRSIDALGYSEVRACAMPLLLSPDWLLCLLQVLSLIQSSGTSLEIGLQRKATPAPNLHIDNLPKGHSFLVELHKRDGALGLRIAGGTDKLTGAGKGCTLVCGRCGSLVPPSRLHPDQASE